MSSEMPDVKDYILDNVDFRMSWLPFTEHIPFAYGIDKGIFEEYGINLRLLNSKGSSDAVKIVASGNNDFGMVSSNLVLTGVAEGMKLKSVAMIYPVTPTCIMSYVDSGIKSPGDLVGKWISSDPASTKQQEFMAFLKKNNISSKEIKFLPASGTSQELANLMNGDADAALGYYFNAMVILEDNGITDIDVLMLKDYGVDFYGKTIVANENIIESNPDLVRRVVAATRKSWLEAMENPAEAVKSLVSHYPELDEKNELKKFRLLIPFLKDENTLEFGFGYQTLDGWNSMQEILYEQRILKNKIDINTAFTNEYISE